MVKQNDKVRIDGRELKVTSIWAQGRHKVYSMSDESLILDLDKKIESGKAELVKENTYSYKNTSMGHKDKEIEKTPSVEEDHEE